MAWHKWSVGPTIQHNHLKQKLYVGGRWWQHQVIGGGGGQQEATSTVGGRQVELPMNKVEAEVRHVMSEGST
jgi:hypothetical protein